MDPLLMVGAWAAALLSIGAVLRGIYTLFLRAVKSAIREEMARVWKDQDDIERRLDALERAMHYMRQQLDALTTMMREHMTDRADAAR
jgi:chaperonin cofactor prefoldin